MNDKKLRQQFHAYLDGELSFEEEERLERALEQKPEMRRELRGLSKTRELLIGLPQEDPGDAFTRDVMARVRTVRASELEPVSVPLSERIANWFGLWLAPKPALGVAMALVLGLVAGIGVQQVLVEGEPGQPVAQTESAPAPAETDALNPNVAVGPDPTDLDRVYHWPGAQLPGSGVTLTGGAADQGRQVEFVVQPYLLRDQQGAEPLFPANDTPRTGQRASTTF